MRYAFRLFAKTPGFTAVAVLTLALGIGANTAVFSVVDALLLRPMPVNHPERLMVLTTSSQKRALTGIPLSLTLFTQLETQARSYSGVAAIAPDVFNHTGAGEPEQLNAARVSPGFFDVLGVHPAMGRGFSHAEGEKAGPLAAMLSDGLWRNRFGADAAVLGKPIQLSGAVYTIIGVLPASFQFPAVGPVDVWVSQLDRYQGLRQEQIEHGAGFLTGIGRLRDGVTQESAAAEALVISHQYTSAHPGFADAEPGEHVDLQELRENVVSGIRRALLVLMAAVGCVLLIACANVAALTMARATGRVKEMALRAALGAGHGALLRQLLAESMLLAVAGAAAGVLLAQLCLSLAAKTLAQYAAGFDAISLNPAVLLFTAAIALATAAAFGLFPAWRSSRPDLIVILRDSGRGNTAGAGRLRLRSLLVAGQAAVSVALLIGAGLLIESFRRVATVAPGFNPSHALTMNVNLPGDEYPDDAARSQFVRAAIERIAALPGVRSVSAGSGMPLTAGQVLSMFLAQGQPAIPVAERPLALWVSATPGYFESLGIRLFAGREFTPQDDAASKPVVVVSQALARHYWPDDDPIGKHIRFTRRDFDYEVVGVAGDVKANSLTAAATPTVYTAYAQYSRPSVWFTLRAAGDPRLLARPVETQIFSLDRTQPVTNVQTLDELVAATLIQRRQVAYLIGGFAVVALALAIIGLYGVLSYSVAQRTTEIGVRQAVGAGRGDILRLVMARGLGLTLAGTAAGAIAGVFVTKPLAGMLYGVTPTDPIVYGAIAVLFALTGAAASLIPAWRAARIDPVEALR